MNSAQEGSPKKDADVRGALVALIGALIAALLVVANIQLANIGNDSGTPGRSTAAVGSALPPPAQGTSNDVLSKELRRLSRNLVSPLNLLRGQLGPLSGLSAGQTNVANSFQNVADSVRNLGSVQQELAAMSAGMGHMVGNTEAMAGHLGSTNTTLSSMDHNIVAAGKSTNESMARMSGGIEAMHESISSMNQFLASTSTETKEMSTSLVQLNSNMEELISLFCTLLTSEADCASAETSTSAAPMHVAETITAEGLAPRAVGATVDLKPMNGPSGSSTYTAP